MATRKKIADVKRKTAKYKLRENPTPYRVNGNGVGNHFNAKEKPRLLDLFCCAGGVAVGYSRAGFEVIGVDIKPQPHFPYEFIQADALTLDSEFLKSFDAIHASPPCQAYSDLAKRNGNADEWPRLIEPVREMIVQTAATYESNKFHQN